MAKGRAMGLSPETSYIASNGRKHARPGSALGERSRFAVSPFGPYTRTLVTPSPAPSLLSRGGSGYQRLWLLAVVVARSGDDRSRLALHKRQQPYSLLALGIHRPLEDLNFRVLTTQHLG